MGAGGNLIHNYVDTYLKGLFSEKLFFTEIKSMGAQYIASVEKTAPIDLRGPKWLQNVDLKIFRALYRTPGIV